MDELRLLFPRSRLTIDDDEELTNGKEYGCTTCERLHPSKRNVDSFLRLRMAFTQLSTLAREILDISRSSNRDKCDNQSSKRGVNKKVLKVPSIEQKVLDATSNESWGPHGGHLADIAQASKNYHEYQMIMSIVWKRLSDTGKNWRHVFKALASFQYIDSTGRDQGSNVRKKSQTLVALVNDKDKIQEAREKAAASRERFRNTPGGPGDDRYEGQYGSREEDRNGYGRERDWNNRDSYGRDSEDHYGQDGYGDNEYRGKSQSIDGDYGTKSQSSDRDDGHHSSRGSNARVEDGSPDGSRLEPKLSGQNLGAPPSYEDAANEAEAPPPTANHQETVLSSNSAPPPPPAASIPPPSATTPSVIKETEEFDLFDPRGAPPAAQSASSSAEVDLFGSLSDSFSSNVLALVPSEPLSTTSPNPNQTFVAAPPTSQQFDDPFGDGPFRAVPSTDAFSAQHSTTPFGEPLETGSQTAANDMGFGDGFDQTIDILAGILPPTGPPAPPAQTVAQPQPDQFSAQMSFPSQTSQPNQTSFPSSFPGQFGQHMPQSSSYPGQSMPPPAFPVQGGFHHSIPPPSFPAQSVLPPGFPAQGSQSMPPSSFLAAPGGQSELPAGFPAQSGQSMFPPSFPVAQHGQSELSSGFPSQGSQSMLPPGLPVSQGGQSELPSGFPTTQGDQSELLSGFLATSSQSVLPPPSFTSQGSQSGLSSGFPVTQGDQSELPSSFPAGQSGQSVLPPSFPTGQSGQSVLPPSFPTGQSGQSMMPHGFTGNQTASFGGTSSQSSTFSQAGFSSSNGQTGQPNNNLYGGFQPQGQTTSAPTPGNQNSSLGGISSRPGTVSQPGFSSSNGQTGQPNNNHYGGFQPQGQPNNNHYGGFQPQSQPNNNHYGGFQPQGQPSHLQSNTSMGTQPPSVTASTGALAIVPQQPATEKFETKSTVWNDTLTRGLVNLNISGSKTNPLSDIGIDFEAINRKEKRMEKPSKTPVTSNVAMGKAMGSGSGIGRAGAGGLRSAPNPMAGPGMGMGAWARVWRWLWRFETAHGDEQYAAKYGFRNEQRARARASDATATC
ncbi:hypothetical protein SSX86_008957 [Deinandra increscens subsp. villosa]|uniref:ENTH domain-containing protein n=1 Tax=Deinandra increscens subsp. villosa TaxID=3103831 RepID=A0AAP0H2J1_9ASTR